MHSKSAPLADRAAGVLAAGRWGLGPWSLPAVGHDGLELARLLRARRRWSSKADFVLELIPLIEELIGRRTAEARS